jgi:hypothetical protein
MMPVCGARAVTESFDDLPWHDAELLEISIDRRSPGVRDQVRLQVAWPDRNTATLVFRNCYAMLANMNFGIVADERILNASQVDDDAELIALRQRWGSLGVSLDMMRCYRLETSSTASVIRIYAMQFETL